MILKYNEFLNEKKKNNEEDKEYGCVMAQIKYSNWKDKILSIIDEKDLYTEEDDSSYGLESEPHITILYGIHSDEVKPNEIKEFIKEYDINKFELKLSDISLFENEKYDVVKFDIDDKDNILTDFNKTLTEKYPFTNKFKDYHPHSTIAYVKKGKGKKYIQKLKEPILVEINRIKYSYPTDEMNKKDKFYVKLKEDK